MIVGEKVQLIALNDDCFKLTYQWINDPMLRRYTGTRFPVTRTEHEKWFLDKSQDHYNKTFGIQIKESEKIIGIVGNSNFEPLDRTTSVFIYLGNVEDRNKGYGKEALDLITQFCFNSLNVRKIWAHIFDFNKESQSLFTRTGYSQEGLLKEHCFRDGKYSDVVVVGRINYNEA